MQYDKINYTIFNICREKSYVDSLASNRRTNRKLTKINEQKYIKTKYV